jgi:hypothetical protein
MAALAARPPEEPIMTALRHTVVEIARACEAGELGFDPGRFECMLTMMSDSPSLMAGSLEHAQRKQALLVEIVAGRMGLDPDDDLRPHVVAAATTCAFQAAADVTRRLGGKFATLSETVDRAFAILENGLNEPSRQAG